MSTWVQVLEQFDYVRRQTELHLVIYRDNRAILFLWSNDHCAFSAMTIFSYSKLCIQKLNNLCLLLPKTTNKLIQQKKLLLYYSVQLQLNLPNSGAVITESFCKVWYKFNKKELGKFSKKFWNPSTDRYKKTTK